MPAERRIAQRQTSVWLPHVRGPMQDARVQHVRAAFIWKGILTRSSAIALTSLDARFNAVQVGDVVEGTVATIQPYGAFVNLGGELNGLLHISQISHDRISSVEQVLEIGQKLKVSSLIWIAC